MDIELRGTVYRVTVMDGAESTVQVLKHRHNGTTYLSTIKPGSANHRRALRAAVNMINKEH